MKLVAAESEIERVKKEGKDQIRKNDMLVNLIKKVELDNTKSNEKIESLNSVLASLKQELEGKDEELRMSNTLNDQILKLMENNKKRKNNN